MDGTDLFALVNAIGWIVGQAPSIAARRDHLLTLVMDGLASPGTGTGRRPDAPRPPPPWGGGGRGPGPRGGAPGRGVSARRGAPPG
ncbi:hypothetical protein ACIP6Y_21010, partial [Streptomyces sp. NPDC088748]